MKTAVWCPEAGDDEEDAKVFDTEDPERAVRLWAERDHYESDYWTESVVRVRVGRREAESYRVTAEQVTTFGIDKVPHA